MPPPSSRAPVSIAVLLALTMQLFHDDGGVADVDAPAERQESTRQGRS